eukprot:5772409-Pleurochrysis_carterae.AAC.1
MQTTYVSSNNAGNCSKQMNTAGSISCRDYWDTVDSSSRGGSKFHLFSCACARLFSSPALRIGALPSAGSRVEAASPLSETAHENQRPS